MKVNSIHKEIIYKKFKIITKIKNNVIWKNV